uniref:ATP synthase complex subunit 8 n=1 Tax=Toxicochlespira sp. MNHN IM 2013-9841 TaxID=2259818 RepID=A0A344H1T3_9COND|nr:ATP synthase F0 subunit 8 [Toxicochlespira sp. MNHN IM 2013-9841]
MPQLSPLNWMLLFVLFWSLVLSFSILIWWSNKIMYLNEKSLESKVKKNKWNW